MNKWIEVYMQEHDLKPNEHFKIISEQDNHEYYFSENGQLCRYSNTGYNYVNYKIWGKVMSGDDIEKVKPKGRYIPKLFDTYYYISDFVIICASTNNETEVDSYIFENNLVFRTEEEAEDYRWFLEQVDKYKKEFVCGRYNYCFYFDCNKKEIVCDYWQAFIYQGLTYFGDEENIKEFRNVVGDNRIKKYMFDVWE